MQVVDSIRGFRKALDEERRAGRSVALVPTMGALHAGHTSLIDAATRRCDVVAATVFVNPLQFAAGEDLSRYPRPFDADVALAERHGASYVFAPSVEEMYPGGVRTTVHVEELADVLEAAARPGHFDGVATVVAKLFNAAGPVTAFFGEKDWQQLQVVRRMTGDLSFPVEIISCPTVRAEDGLALSSRNAYLDDAERAAAPVIYRALCTAAALVSDGTSEVARLRDAMRATIAAEPLVHLEYAEALHAHDEIRLLVAARVGTTRLIDNLGVRI
ncbi:MAG TPA: pantoate--beta-alanine ligase [Acidimicrobiales bacterium]|nr:pantoate--beta-alanine ligase [Acidimicrobiales bacterium]